MGATESSVPEGTSASRKESVEERRARRLSAALGRGALDGGALLGPGLQRGRTGNRDGPRATADGHFEDVRAAAHAGHLVRLEHTAVSAHDAPHDRLVHWVSPAYGPRTSMRTLSPRSAAATTTVLSM